MLQHSEVFCSQLDHRVGGKCIAIAISKKRSPFVDKNRLSALSLPTQKKRSSSLTKTIAHSPIISINIKSRRQETILYRQFLRSPLAAFKKGREPDKNLSKSPEREMRGDRKALTLVFQVLCTGQPLRRGRREISRPNRQTVDWYYIRR